MNVIPIVIALNLVIVPPQEGIDNEMVMDNDMITVPVLLDGDGEASDEVESSLEVELKDMKDLAKVEDKK